MIHHYSEYSSKGHPDSVFTEQDMLQMGVSIGLDACGPTLSISGCLVSDHRWMSWK